MVYTVTWDEAAVSNDTFGYDLDTKINNNLIAVRERLAEEHLSPAAGSGLEYAMHAWNITSKSTGSPYTALVTDHVLLITTGASNYEIDLPSAATYPGKPYKIKKVDSGAGCVIIDPSGAETIDGYSGWTLVGINDFIEIVSDGTNWIINACTGGGSTSVGQFGITALRTAPAGWLLCNGTAYNRTTYANLFAALCPTIGNPTISIATPGVITLVSHGLEIGDAFYLTTTGALPTGLSINTIYYVITAGFGADSFQCSATKAGTAIDTTGTQSGTHTLNLCPYGLGNGTTTFNVPDLRQKFLLGKAASGTGVNIGETGGTIDHTHAAGHVHTGPSHTHAITITSYATPWLEGATANESPTITAAGGTDNTGSATVPAENSPYLAGNYIIKV